MNIPESRQGEDTIARAVAFDVLNSDMKVPSMPANGLKLMDMARQPINKIDMGMFAKLIEPDPVLYSRVLQLANSTYFKGVTEIVSLRSAITRIGLEEAINLVNLFFLRQMLPNPPKIQGFSAKDYWAYSWACAIAGRRLGHPSLTATALPGDLYIAGLLQGIGKFILSIHDPGKFSRCIQRAVRFEQPLHAVLLDELGTTDNKIASQLMSVWNIPARICAAVEFSQDPGSAPEEYRELAALIQFAYGVAAHSGIGSNGDGVLPDLEATWMVENTTTPLARKSRRDKIVKEVIASLEEKSEVITGVPAKAKASSARSMPSTVRNSAGSGQKKRGVMAWIKGFFGR